MMESGIKENEERGMMIKELIEEIIEEMEEEKMVEEIEGVI